MDKETKAGRLNSIRFFGYLSLAITITMIAFKGAVGGGDMAIGFLLSLAIMYWGSSKLALDIISKGSYNNFFNRLIFYFIFVIAQSVLNIVIFGLLAN